MSLQFHINYQVLNKQLKKRMLQRLLISLQITISLFGSGKLMVLTLQH